MYDSGLWPITSRIQFLGCSKTKSAKVGLTTDDDDDGRPLYIVERRAYSVEGS